jgi:hypothetical protein
MLKLWQGRCEYFITPQMLAARRFDPRYIRLPVSSEVDDAVKRTFRLMETDAHPYADILTDKTNFEIDLRAEINDLNDGVAFSPRALATPPYKWAITFLAKYPHLAYCVIRLLALSCSASGCEHAWSIEGWIHSKKRNRLGQTNVERLVRSHTNLLLEALLEDWQDEILPWDIELIIEEPEPEPDTTEPDTTEPDTAFDPVEPSSTSSTLSPPS